MTTYFRCFRCNEILVRYDEWAHDQFWVGEFGHQCKDGSHAITKINKWYDKNGKEIVYIKRVPAF